MSLKWKYKLNLKGVSPQAIHRTQQFIDSEIIRRSSPFIPLKTGQMEDSGEHGTRIGTGVIRYTAPYAKFQYFKGRSSGQRGRKWVRRMWIAQGKDVIKNARKFLKDR